MDKLSAYNLLKSLTFENENTCWIPTKETRSIRVGEDSLSFSKIALCTLENIPNVLSYRPIRRCGNGWCYNPEHLIFDEMEKFYSYARMDDIDSCWEWIHAKDGGGYGAFVSQKYGREKAHRISYMESYGEIPNGMFVCHKCDNPSCINPRHLFLGTNQDNINDKVKKNRQSRMNGISNGRNKLSLEDVKNMRNDYNTGNYSYRDLVGKYKISQTQVSRIIKNESWAWA